MPIELSPEQRLVVDSDAPVRIVLGGAGTGKTSTASAAVREALAADPNARALFLSFSRSAVGQILDRTGLEPAETDRVWVTTFHAFAWDLIGRWGPAIGHTDPRLFSPSEAALFGTSDGLAFDDLIPAAMRLLQFPAVAEHLRARWTLVVCDEFQDTSTAQWNLLMSIRGSAALLLLGDLNQCIYTGLPNSAGVGASRIVAAEALDGSQRFDLPPDSFRDPSNVLSRAAVSALSRDFGSADIRHALDSGALAIFGGISAQHEVQAVASTIGDLQATSERIGVFSHHINSTAVLSDGLAASGIAHEMVGVPDTLDAAIAAQFAMLRLATGVDLDFRRALAVFVVSTERRGNVPPLAQMIAGLSPMSAGLDARLITLSTDLRAATGPAAAADIAEAAFDTIGFTKGQRSWGQAASVVRGMLGPRLLAEASWPEVGIEHLQEQVAAHRYGVLTYSSVGSPSSHVDVMGLYQAKGREYDATVVVLRADDFFGLESEPMPIASRLVYVLLTRARRRTVILLVGGALKPLVDPFRRLATPFVFGSDPAVDPADSSPV
jgi:DNA helicase II / ATP-dependent DNA helicase PcrA